MAVNQRWEKLPEQNCASYHITVGPPGAEPERVILILLESPSGGHEAEYILDESAGELETYTNVVGYSLSTEPERPRCIEFILACPNKPTQRSSFQVEAVKLIKSVAPDIVLVANKWAARSLFGELFVEKYGYLRKYRFESTDIDGHVESYRCETCYTIDVVGWTDPDPAIKGDNGGGYINLIGQFIHHLQSAIRGASRHTIWVPPIEDLEIQTVDSLDRFDDFYQQLLATDTPSYDLETDNLNRTTGNNRILTMHWLLPTDAEDGWYDLFFIPYAHRQSNWLPDELHYIKKKMRHYFESCKSKYIIGHGLKFDMTQNTNQLGVRWMNHRVYDTISGEFLLDENRKFLSQIGFEWKRSQGPYTLGMLEKGYGYKRPGTIMGKEDRGNMASKDLEEIKPYGSIDVITPYLIHQCQMAEARRRGYSNYLRHVADQLSMTFTMMSSMEAVGIAADASYLQKMTMPNSEINTTIAASLEGFKSSPAAIKINEDLLRERGHQGTGLFGNTEKPWLFNIANSATQHRLFFDELKLEPVSFTTKGTPQVNKAFQSAYSNVPEVALFNRWKKMGTVKNTFVDRLHERLISEPDAVATGRIFPDFNFIGVLTGRGSSSNPNSQNQPSQGKLAKLVKRVWIAPLGKVLLKPDYSAHEVRGLGNVSGDPKIKEVFGIADAAILRARLATIEELGEALKNLKANGDVHILNVKFFFNQVVDKSHPLRYGIKAVVFGVIYGKGAFSLGTGDLKSGLKDAIKALKEKLVELGEDPSRITFESELAASEEKMANYSDEDWKEEADGLIKKLNENWRVGSNWIKGVHEAGAENLVIFSQIGWPRHLASYLHASRKVRGAMNRRGPNSIIQGFSSQTGYCAAYCIKREIWHTFVKNDIDIGMFQVNTVHDSLTNECNFVAAPIGIYLLEHGMTTLTMNHYKETYGVETPVPYGTGLEIGHREDSMIEWKDFRFDTMADNLTKLHADIMERQRPILVDGKLPEGTVASEFSGRVLTDGDLKDCLHNLDRVAAVRHKELRDGKGEMLLRGKTGWFEKHMHGL